MGGRPGSRGGDLYESSTVSAMRKREFAAGTERWVFDPTAAFVL
jgi:hypothetical protein